MIYHRTDDLGNQFAENHQYGLVSHRPDDLERFYERDRDSI